MASVTTTHSSLASFVRSVSSQWPVAIEPVVDWTYDGDERVGRAYVEVTTMSSSEWGILEIDQLVIALGVYPAGTITARTAAQQAANDIADIVTAYAGSHWKRVKSGRVHVDVPLDERQSTPWMPEEWEALATGAVRGKAVEVAA